MVMGMPAMLAVGERWKRGSSILTALPRPRITATPWATHHMPRVEMNEGMRTWC